MTREKVLYITTESIAADTSAAIRNRAFVQGLCRCGFCVHTLSPVKVRGEQDGFSGVTFHHLIDAKEQEPVLYKEVSKFGIKSFVLMLKRFISGFLLYDGCRRYIRHIGNFRGLDREFAYMFSSSDSKVAHLIADVLIKKNKVSAKKWIQYWGDPFYTDINRTNFLPGFIVRREEKRLLSLADAILYTSPMTLFTQQKLYKEAADKMTFVPTAYAKERVYAKRRSNEIKVGYYGDFRSKDRNILPFYSAACKSEEGFTFEIVGRSDLTLKEQPHISIKGRISGKDVLEREEACDILVCVGNKPESTQLPGKIFHYLATDKHVLYIYEKKDKNTEYLESLGRIHTVLNDAGEIAKKLVYVKECLDRKVLPYTDFYCEKVVKDAVTHIETAAKKNPEGDEKRLFVFWDKVWDEKKLLSHDVVLTRSLCVYNSLKGKCKVYIADFYIDDAEGNAARAVNTLFSSVKSAYHIHRNEVFSCFFDPVYSICRQIAAIVDNEGIKRLILKGGSNHPVITFVHGEGEGVKKFYKTSWLFNPILYHVFKDMIPVSRESRKNAFAFKLLNVLREDYFLIKSILRKACVCAFRYRLKMNETPKEPLMYVCVCNLKLQYTHLKGLLKERFGARPFYIAPDDFGESDNSHILIRKRLGYKDLFKIIRETIFLSPFEKDIKKLKITIHGKETDLCAKTFTRALKTLNFGYLCFYTELCNTLNELSFDKNACLVTDMTFGEDIAACYKVAKRYNLKHINFQYVAMRVNMLPNLYLADTYYLYSKSVYELYRKTNPGFLFYLPIRKKPDINICISDVRNVTLFTQPDQYTPRYLQLISDLAEKVTERKLDDKIKLFIKPHYRQDMIERFYDFENKYSFIQTADKKYNVEELISASDVCITMTSSILFEALMSGKMCIIADVDGIDTDVIKNSGRCFSEVHFVVTTADDIISLCSDQYEFYYNKFLSRYDEFVKNSDHDIERI